MPNVGVLRTTKVDQSALDMSTLRILPVELLEWITGVLEISDQVHLWQCGDRILNYKLKNGGLNSTSLQWSSIPWMPWPRPFFANFTGLRAVSWNAVAGSSLCPTLELNLLSPTLQRLELRFDDIFCLLRKQNVNLNDLFPRLEILKLEGKCLREENLKQLPERLLRLSVIAADSASTIESKTMFRDLPATIERLELKFPMVDLEEFENCLPKGLTELLISCPHADFDWLRKVPKSVTKLLISIYDNPADYHHLPAGLEELDIHHPEMPESFLPLLPANLKALKLFYPQFDDDKIGLLPKNLTKLRIHKTMGRSTLLTHVALQRLPTTLTEYDFCVKATHPQILSFYNPDTTKMSLELVEGIQLERTPFPPKISSLTITGIYDDICELLPPQLTDLKIHSGLITPKGASKLPKSLLVLDAILEVFDTNETISYLGYIPSISLTSRAAGPPRSLNEKWLSFLRPLPDSVPIENAENDALELISRSHAKPNAVNKLEIAIGYSSSHRLGEDSFQALSRMTHLSILDLGQWGPTPIPVSYLQFLPQNLTVLRFGHLCDFPTPSNLSALPKRLRNLEFGVQSEKTCWWKDEDFEALPRSLHFFMVHGFHCSYPNLTDGVLEFVPPYLTEMNIGNSRFSAVDRLYGPDEQPYSFLAQPIN